MRGVAIFACAADDMWRVIELPVPVRTRVVVNHTPAVGQLESVLREHEPIGVLLADRQRARMFVFELGELVERSELFEQALRDIDGRGDRDRAATTPRRSRPTTSSTCATAAHVAFAVWSQHPFAHLAIAAPDDLAGQLEATLHPYLRERLAGRLSRAGHRQPRAGAGGRPADRGRGRAGPRGRDRRPAAGGGVRRRGASPGLARRRRGPGRAPGRHAAGVVGLLGAGWRCTSCDRLAAMGRRCRTCEQEMVEVDDLVEDAVEEALAQSCRVEICVGNADLDVLGRVGALLRY